MQQVKSWVLENTMLTIATLIAIISCIHRILFIHEPLSNGFWNITLFVVLFITIKIIEIFIRKYSLKKEKEEVYKETTIIKSFINNAKLFIFLVNLPCWYFLQSSPFLYFWGFFLILSLFPRKN